MHGGRIDDCSDELIDCFQDMKSQGLIRAYGINTFDIEVLEWVADNRAFDYVMLDYNIMRQDREPIIEKLSKNGIGVIAGMALGQSLFSKNIFHVRSRNDLWYLARAMIKFRSNLNKTKSYKFLAQQSDYIGNQIALRFVLDNQFITSAVFSTISKNHLLENIEATKIMLSSEITERIKMIGGVK